MSTLKTPLICKSCGNGIITTTPFTCITCSGNFHPRCAKSYSKENPNSCCSTNFTKPTQFNVPPMNFTQNNAFPLSQQQPRSINLNNFNQNSPFSSNLMSQIPTTTTISSQLSLNSQAIANNNTLNPDQELLPENWDSLTTDQKITFTLTTILRNQQQSNETNTRQQNQIDSNTQSIYQIRQQQSHSLSKTEIIISGLSTSITNPYEEIVKYTFDAIGASQLIIHVLGIRRFLNQPSQQNTNLPSHFSLAVHVNGHDIALKLISFTS